MLKRNHTFWSSLSACSSFSTLWNSVDVSISSQRSFLSAMWLTHHPNMVFKKPPLQLLWSNLTFFEIHYNFTSNLNSLLWYHVIKDGLRKNCMSSLITKQLTHTQILNKLEKNMEFPNWLLTLQITITHTMTSKTLNEFIFVINIK